MRKFKVGRGNVDRLAIMSAYIGLRNEYSSTCLQGYPCPYYALSESLEIIAILKHTVSVPDTYVGM